MLSEDELIELADDIAANGLYEAIKLDPTGEILVDGRNREAACDIAGVEPRRDESAPPTSVRRHAPRRYSRNSSP
jgi:ParB-like chromosome segregation protein Spo0J